MGTTLFNSVAVLAITITDKSGAQRRVHFTGADITVGRLEDNDLVLQKNNVSKRHARLMYSDGRYVVSDLHSTNGTYINGRRITAPVVLKEGDKIYVGDYILSLTALDGSKSESASGRSGPPVPPLPQAESAQDSSLLARVLPAGRPQDPSLVATQGSDAPPKNSDGRTMVSAPPQAPQSSAYQGPTRLHAAQAQAPRVPLPRGGAEGSANTTTGLRPVGGGRPETGIQAKSVHASGTQRAIPIPSSPPPSLTPTRRLQGALATLMDQLDFHEDEAGPQAYPAAAAYEERLDEAINRLAREGAIGADLDRRFLREAALNEAAGLGPLERLLKDPATRHVVVDSPTRILADQGNGLLPMSLFFSGPQALTSVIERLLSLGGVTYTPNSPLQRATLPQGHQVTVWSTPLAQPGPVLAIHCARQEPISPETLTRDAWLSNDMLDLLRQAVLSKQNILVCGEPGADISAVSSGIAGLCPKGDRLLLIAARPGMAIDHPQVLALTTHSTDLSSQTLLDQAGRLRCDRLIIDRMESGSTLPILLFAATMGGVVMGMHISGQDGGLSHLSLHAQLASNVQAQALHALVQRAVRLVVYVRRERDGQQHVSRIAEVVPPASGGPPEERALFVHEGGFRSMGVRPAFLGD